MGITRRDFFKLAIAAGAAMGLPRARRSFAEGPPARILWFSWDGADWRSVKRMLKGGELPALGSLHVTRLECAGFTGTTPGHIEAITGLDYYVTGVRTNRKFAEVPKEWTAFWRLKQALPDYWCGAIFSKHKYTGDAPGQPWHPTGAWARTGGLDYWHNTNDYTFLEDTNYHLAAALAAFQPPGLVYCHWQEPDYTGHRDKCDSEPYRQQLRELDLALGQAMAALQPDFVLLYSDHGFNSPGSGSHANAPDGFLACSQPVKRDGLRRDVAFTMLKVLGIPTGGRVPQPEGELSRCQRLAKTNGKDLRR